MCLLILNFSTLAATRFEDTVAPLPLARRQDILNQMSETLSRDTTFLCNTSTDEQQSFIPPILLAQARHVAETGIFRMIRMLFLEK